MDKQFGFTKAGFTPAYFNLSEADEGFTITVRSQGDGNETGPVASMDLSRDACRQIVSGMQALVREAEAKALWKWIEGFMESECNHLPEYLSDADRDNIVNAIKNTLAGA